MTSRRLIRIKALQLLYAYFKKDGTTISEVEKELSRSIKKTTDLYYYIFLIITEIQHKAFLKIDNARNKHLASEEDLNPNTRFIDNPVIEQISSNLKFKNYIKSNLISITDCMELITHLYNQMVNSEFYINYMNKENVTYHNHKQLILSMISELLAPDDEFYQVMEEKNIFWNDDYELVLSIAYKTVKNLKETDGEDDQIFLALFDYDEDSDYAKNLLRKSILEMTSHSELIESFTHNWDIDRISDMEKLIMNMAITELKFFPNIPIKVTFDEYIEITKSYCSGKSSSFVNGILDKIQVELKEKNQLHKSGRGLME